MSMILSLLIISLSFLPLSLSINLTTLLSPYQSLSSFSTLLTTSSLSSLSLSSPFSILTIPNYLLIPSPPPFPPSSTSLSDLLRFHILLSPLPSLSSLPVRLPTLLQTTGRYSLCSLDIAVNRETGNITINTANVIGILRSGNVNVTIVMIDSFVFPDGMVRPEEAKETGGGEVFSPPVNITKALMESHGFNVFTSILLASGLVDEFQRDESGAGLTIFVPTDEAFANIPSSADFQSLTADQKAVVLRFHCIRSYYPLGSLQAIVNPLQPTLATEIMGAGKYTLNVSSVNGSVILDTGIVRSTVDQTVFDENPVAIFGVKVVFLPKEIFGGDEVVSSKRGDDVVEAPGPEEYAPVGDVKSLAAGGRSFGMGFVCTALLYLLV